MANQYLFPCVQDVSQQESIKSSCTKLKTRLQKLEREANFRAGVAQAVQSSLRPFYINASHPVKVKIGSKEKFDRQVAYLAGKVLRTELQRAEHHNFNVDDQMRKNIRVLVDQVWSFNNISFLILNLMSFSRNET